MTMKRAISQIPPKRITDDELKLMTPEHPKWEKFLPKTWRSWILQFPQGDLELLQRPPLCAAIAADVRGGR
jgi:hypothetical protein